MVARLGQLSPSLYPSGWCSTEAVCLSVDSVAPKYGFFPTGASRRYSTHRRTHFKGSNPTWLVTRLPPPPRAYDASAKVVSQLRSQLPARPRSERAVLSPNTVGERLSAGAGNRTHDGGELSFGSANATTELRLSPLNFVFMAWRKICTLS